MAARLTNKWTVLLALQRRLDAKRVSRYEAVLGKLAIERLFNVRGSSAQLADIDQLWEQQVHTRLAALIEGCEWNDDEGEAWIEVWRLHHSSEMVVAETGLAELFGSDQHGLQPVPPSRQAPGRAGADARDADAAVDPGTDRGHAGDRDSPQGAGT